MTRVHLSLALMQRRRVTPIFIVILRTIRKRNGIRNEEALFNLIMRALILLRWLRGSHSAVMRIIFHHLLLYKCLGVHPRIIELHECVENYCYWMRRINNDH